MSKTLVYIGIIGLVIIAALLGYNIYQQQSISEPSSLAENSPPVNRAIQKADPKTSTAPKVVTYKPNEGIVDSVNATTLVLKSGETNQTYSVAKTQYFQRILSGTFDSGGVYQQATRADVKAGQHVLLIVPQDSKNVTAVFLLK